MGKHFFTLIMLLLVSAHFVFSDFEEEGFDYADGNYDDIDWGSFTEWEKIPDDRIEDVPADKLDYAQLNAGQRQHMTSSQISQHFERIDNLNGDVNPRNAEQAIQEKFGTSISLSGDASLKEGTLRTPEKNGLSGDWIHMNSLSSETGVTVTESGRIILVGETKPPGKGAYQALLDGKRETTLSSTFTGGEERKATIEGKVLVNHGAMYLTSNSATIDGVVVRKRRDPVLLNFDPSHNPDSYMESYVTFDAQEKTLFAKGNLELRFFRDNPYLKPSPDEIRRLNGPYFVLDGYTMEVMNRDDKELIPLVTLSSANNRRSNFYMENGHVPLYETREGGRTNLGMPLRTFTSETGEPLPSFASVPMELKLEGDIGEELIISDRNSIGRITDLESGGSPSGCYEDVFVSCRDISRRWQFYNEPPKPPWYTPGEVPPSLPDISGQDRG